MEQELGLASAHADKLLFTVQIYDSFYVPNRKPLRFIGDNGAVGNTPGNEQIQLPQLSPLSPLPFSGPAHLSWWHHQGNWERLMTRTAGLPSPDGSSDKAEGRKVEQANG